MTKYTITIKDNSIPEWMITNPHAITEYTATLTVKSTTVLCSELDNLIEEYAIDLNTDTDSLEILSIIKN